MSSVRTFSSALRFDSEALIPAVSTASSAPFDLPPPLLADMARISALLTFTAEAAACLALLVRRNARGRAPLAKCGSVGHGLWYAMRRRDEARGVRRMRPRNRLFVQ